MFGQPRQSPQLLSGANRTTGTDARREVIEHMAKRTVNKSATTGRFVSNRQVARSPKTTYKQTVPGRSKK